MKKTLLIMQKVNLINEIRDALGKEGFAVIISTDGRTGMDLALREEVDLVIMDVMMPNVDGFGICRKIKRRKLLLPIIILTSKAKETEKIMGLELCADDYITEPFNMKELIARIHVCLRRADAHAHASAKKLDSFTIGDVKIYFSKMEAFKKNKKLIFSKKELDVLKYLINRRKEVISRNDLLDVVWGVEEAPLTRTVDVFMSRIRKKIENNPSRPKYIKSIRSAGYKLDI